MKNIFFPLKINPLEICHLLLHHHWAEVLHIYIPILAARKKFVMMDVVYRSSLPQVSYITAQW